MQFKQLFKDERAVSPVIGVILMVAITVILAAVIGTFVLGLGNNLQETPPNVNFNFDYSDNNDGTYTVTATHQGGQTITQDNANSLLLVGEDTSGSEVTSQFSGWGSDGVSSGDTASDSTFAAGTDVRVVWTSSEGSSSQSLAEGTIPN